MALSFYDVSVMSYLQNLEGVSNVLARGADHCQKNGVDLEEVVQSRLHPDMLPFQFQLISVAHHSLGAIRGIQGGVFTPPPPMPDLDYAGLQSLVEDASTQLQQLSREEVDALETRELVFKIGDTEIPFTATNFLLSFSLPNFYFHATTAYDMLRTRGVPLGKRDYMGQMRVGSAN
jgi:uncharacterized protein